MGNGRARAGRASTHKAARARHAPFASAPLLSRDGLAQRRVISSHDQAALSRAPSRLSSPLIFISPLMRRRIYLVTASAAGAPVLLLSAPFLANLSLSDSISSSAISNRLW